MPIKNMTYKEGLAIQAEHLADHKTKLNATTYAALEAYCKEQNFIVMQERQNPRAGFLIVRGVTLTNWIANYRPSKATETSTTNTHVRVSESSAAAACWLQGADDGRKTALTFNREDFKNSAIN